MATFVLIHGGGSSGWEFHLLEAELRALGHDVVAPDLPIEDGANGLAEYADAVVTAVGAHQKQTGARQEAAAVGAPEDLVVVGHSFGGLVAPLVCDRLPSRMLVLLAGMIPRPGEPASDWWANTGHQAEVDMEADPIGAFLHDVPTALAEEALAKGRPQESDSLGKPWPLAAWPVVPTKVLAGRDDRFFPLEFMRRVARDRLGLEPDVIGGSHCMALSRPKELAARLDGYLAAEQQTAQ
ncbi:alpha/beta fold hydrolase [Amycolatopsis sp. 195334CR]|uniref:alpha/beta fold hydrolase n=1 Tax=Amycolatopsis sp. 195334CR TaxID=2814588 RepID=UPI001A8DFD4B|nr:alpha/beta hydrolase [Amycolatopsis sp. 195334CR]MBN6039937.1 alpha/beta hydrolase [Amycolatopsis sp. 195334CR]